MQSSQHNSTVTTHLEVICHSAFWLLPIHNEVLQNQCLRYRCRQKQGGKMQVVDTQGETKSWVMNMREAWERMDLVGACSW